MHIRYFLSLVFGVLPADTKVFQSGGKTEYQVVKQEIVAP